MVWEKYYNNNSKTVFFSARFGRWKASDIVGDIKDRIYILPCVSFYFNSSEFDIRLAWLNFDSIFHYVNFRKERIY